MKEIMTPEAAASVSVSEKRGLFWFYGEEDYLKKRTAERIIRGCLGDDPDGFGKAVIDLNGGGTVDDIASELMSPPMMCPCKVITAVGFDAEKDSAKTFSAVTDAVLSAAGISAKEKDPSFDAGAFPDTVLILVSRANEFSAQKKAFSTAAYKRFASVFSPVCFDIQPEQRLCDWIIKSLARDGLSISRADAAYLSDRCLGSMYMLRTEMDKLTAVCGERVSRDDVDKYVSAAARDVPFALSNAVMKKDPAGLVKLIASEKAKKGEPIALMAAISSCVSDMLKVKYLAAAGLSADTAAKKLQMNSYRAGLFYTAVRGVGVKKLEDTALACYETEIKLKSTQQDPWILLDVLSLGMR